MVTDMTSVPTAALQARPRAGCTLVFCVICKIALPTVLDTMSFQKEKWPFTAGALMRTLALETVAVTALAEAPVLVERWQTLLHTGPVLEDVAVHALQAVCPQRPSALIATPVALFACLGGDIQVVLRGTALILAFPKEQHLAGVSAGGTAGL